MTSMRSVLERHRASYARNPFGMRVALVMTLDLACLVVAAFAARYWAETTISDGTFISATAILAIGTFLVLQATGAYDLVTIRSSERTRVSLLLSLGIGFAAALVFYFAVPLPESEDALLHAAAVFLPLFLLERSAFRSVSKRMRNRILLVGASDLGIALVHSIAVRSDLGLEVVGFLSGNDEEERRSAPVGGVPVLGTVHAVEKVMSQGIADWVVVTSKRRDEDLPADQLLSLKLQGVPIFSGSALYERITGEVYHRSMRSSVLIFDDRLGMTLFERFTKRAFDLMIALVALVFTAPILLAAAIAIRLDTKGTIFFRQTRVGRFHKPFQILKLRTMVEGAERDTGAVFASRQDLRITRVGHFLRRTRIDELPQFWNVVKGDMDLVGPRPEILANVQTMSEEIPYYGLRHSVRPGLTGWAQTRFGYSVSLEQVTEKIRYDLFYIKQMSFWLDLRILVDTVKIMLFGRGAK